MKKKILINLILSISLLASSTVKAEESSTLAFERQYPNLANFNTAFSQFLLTSWASNDKQLSQDPSLPHDGAYFQDKSACIMAIPVMEVSDFLVRQMSGFAPDDLMEIEQFAKSRVGQRLKHTYEMNSKKVFELEPFEMVNSRHLINPLSKQDKEEIWGFYQTSAGTNFMTLINKDLGIKMLEITRTYCW